MLLGWFKAKKAFAPVLPLPTPKTTVPVVPITEIRPPVILPPPTVVPKVITPVVPAAPVVVTQTTVPQTISVQAPSVEIKKVETMAVPPAQTIQDIGLGPLMTQTYLVKNDTTTFEVPLAANYADSSAPHAVVMPGQSTLFSKIVFPTVTGRTIERQGSFNL